MIETPVIWFTVLPAAAYLIGSVPFGVLIAKARGKDLRQAGSGNVGATNCGRVCGRPWGYVCFLLDFAKGFGPAMAGGWLIGAMTARPEVLQQAAWLAVAAGCIGGHVFSVFLGFRGGKGVATSLGVVVGMYPLLTWAGLAAFGTWLVVVLISRYISLASIVASIAFLAWFCFFNAAQLGGLWPLLAFATAIVTLIVVRHRGNILRLVKGTENRIGGRRAATDAWRG
ncbi:MAG: glycerol-3-phosphate 1-O-acyltransferase PlsY [Planctomycetes bacterium]|jgi:glycerol-3-phosphate acyltransferase PlsY|nr:glycerol-3-phosphate 1-O-acyltransferase PlsY [Phycisphaerae bacterium]NBB96045.1 glycerol-3-phosphate 1-O-acyltransferase PlsY [Planctomycetota bacterium]